MVDLYLKSGWGAEFTYDPGYGKLPEIRVGVSGGDWEQVVSGLLHELLEFALNDVRCRWAPAEDYGQGSDGYLFVFTHPELSEVCGRIAGFLVECLPQMSSVFKRVVKDGVK